VIAGVCEALGRENSIAATDLLRDGYPFVSVPPAPRGYGPLEATRVFVRDGFIDRYAGTRLVFPPVLRLISLILPGEFPYHPNWKTDRTHAAFWELGATIDHVIPITRGGPDDDSNRITTSMARNSAKTNSTLEETGWRLHPPGRVAEWDGLLQWFLDYTAAHPRLKPPPSLRPWHRAALRVTR
jgi:hypothetical protein